MHENVHIKIIGFGKLKSYEIFTITLFIYSTGMHVNTNLLSMKN